MTPKYAKVTIQKFFDRPRRLKEDEGDKRAGDMVSDHWVAYCKIGKANMGSTERRVSRVLTAKRPDPGETDIHVLGAWELAEMVREGYEHFLAGTEIPTEGTPLSAWTQLNENQVAAFKNSGILTIEDLSEIPDNLLSKIPLPQVRELRAMAKRFLLAADANHASAELEEQSKKIAALEAQLASMGKSKQRKSA